MWLMSSDASCLSSVVFPPLSRPSSSILTSWSGVLFSLRRMDSNPCDDQEKTIKRKQKNVRAQGELCCSGPPLHKRISSASLTGRKSASHFIGGWRCRHMSSTAAPPRVAGHTALFFIPRALQGLLFPRGASSRRAHRGAKRELTC